MERGLMWFPLLGMFIWLAKAGSDEYHKIEAYRRWAVGFDRCKYDIYAVMGLKDREISWGKPTKAEPKDLKKFSLDRVNLIRLVIDNLPANLDNLPDKGKKINLQFQLDNGTESNGLPSVLSRSMPEETSGARAAATAIDIPFTEIPLAAEWAGFLQQAIVQSGEIASS
jgi:hypothetical protein